MMLARSIVTFGIAALVLTCGRKADPEAEAMLKEEEYARRLKEDSIQSIATADSLFAVADTVEGPGQHLRQPSLRKSKQESYRLTAEFSFGQSPAGPLLSVMAQQRDSKYVLVTISFPEPERRRNEITRELSREDFLRIAHYFDSINFTNMPGTIYTDYQVMDASRYYVESVKDGAYHRITRSKPIEKKVYDLWAEVLTIGKFDQELIEMFMERARSKEKRH